MKDPFTVCSHIAICRLLVRVCVHTLIIAYCFGNRYTHALHRVLYCILPSAPLCFVLGSSLQTQSPGDILREGLRNLFGLVVFTTRTANLMWEWLVRFPSVLLSARRPHWKPFPLVDDGQATNLLNNQFPLGWRTT